MPTFIGVVFLLIAAFCFMWKEDALFGVLVVAAAFQASSAINLGERGIAPYYVVALFIILRAACKISLGVARPKLVPQSSWLLLFGAISVVSALWFPILFAGIPVYDPKVGIDDSFFIRPPLSLSLNNFAQAGFLMWHIATAYALVVLKGSERGTRKALMVAFYIVFSVLLIQSAFQIVGIPFPYHLILNNPGYAIWGSESVAGGTRNPGTFSEPSIAGGFLVFYCMWFLAEYLSGKGRMIRVLMSFVAMALVASTGSLLTLSITVPLLLISTSPLRWPWYLHITRAKRLLYISLVLITPTVLVLIMASTFRETLMDLTVSKAGSGSFVNRTAADLYALQLLVRSHWMGVGLGSNRASSLLTTLLSNVGIAGVLTFAVFYWRIFRGLARDQKWLVWAAFSLLLNMMIGIPDVTMPLLWVPVFVASQFARSSALAERMNPAVRRQISISNAEQMS